MGRPYEDMRWSRFRNFAPDEMFTVVDRHVFPFLRTLGGNGSTYAHHMKDARFTIPTPQLLAKVVDLIAEVPMEDRDTKGDLYEYMPWLERESRTSLSGRTGGSLVAETRGGGDLLARVEQALGIEDALDSGMQLDCSWVPLPRKLTVLHDANAVLA